MCYNGHTWPTNLSTTPFFLAVPISRATRYVRNVFPIKLSPPSLSNHYPLSTQHPFQMYHRVIFITPKTIHTTKAIYTILCLKDFTIYKNFLTLWLQTFFQTNVNHILQFFLYIWYILYKVAKKSNLQNITIILLFVYTHSTFNFLQSITLF